MSPTRGPASSTARDEITIRLNSSPTALPTPRRRPHDRTGDETPGIYYRSTSGQKERTALTLTSENY
eukprot:7066760-Prymnesium_polylepis.1